MTNSQKIILSVLVTIACVLIVFILYSGAQSYQAWAQRPLGPALEFSTAGELPATWTVLPGSPRTTSTLAPTLSYETQTAIHPFLPCANLPGMIILAIGNDSRKDDYRYGRADVIRAVRVDFKAQRVTMVAFPRDIWVKIPEIVDDIGTSRQKLNTAYTYGNPGLQFWDHPSQGPGLLAQTLLKNFGLSSDHYIAVSMQVFVDVVDALGGLDITLPEEGVDGRSASDRSSRLVFPGGEQHLSGEQALTLARIRNVSTFARAKHQNLVMCTLQEKIKSPETITKIPEIIDSFQKHVQTDLTPAQISQLACLATQMPRSNIQFVSFPRELFSSGEVYDPIANQKVFIWEVDFGQLRQYVDRFETGAWPAVSQSNATPEPGTSSCE